MAKLNSIIRIRGMIPVSMLDWEGKLSTVLFTGGCNLKCPFCQNPELVLESDLLPEICWEEIEKHLNLKSSWLDGVVITGGEPTINHGLDLFLSKLKKKGYPVKLDTNGTRPQVLRQLINNNLIDAVAMDVKTSFEKYNEAVGKEIDIECIKESIDLLVEKERAELISAEFRTTVVPSYVTQEDLLYIASYLKIKGGSNYTLQQFSPNKVIDLRMRQVKPYSPELLKIFRDELNEIIPTKLKGVNYQPIEIKEEKRDWHESKVSNCRW